MLSAVVRHYLLYAANDAGRLIHCVTHKSFLDANVMSFDGGGGDESVSAGRICCATNTVRAFGRTARPDHIWCEWSFLKIFFTFTLLLADTRVIRPASFFRRAAAELIDFFFGFAFKLLVLYILVELELVYALKM
jgi:hypothetical protein